MPVRQVKKSHGMTVAAAESVVPEKKPVNPKAPPPPPPALPWVSWARSVLRTLPAHPEHTAAQQALPPTLSTRDQLSTKILVCPAPTLAPPVRPRPSRRVFGPLQLWEPETDHPNFPNPRVALKTQHNRQFL